jgi:hypothetical protein
LDLRLQSYPRCVEWLLSLQHFEAGSGAFPGPNLRLFQTERGKALQRSRGLFETTYKG